MPGAHRRVNPAHRIRCVVEVPFYVSEQAAQARDLVEQLRESPRGTNHGVIVANAPRLGVAQAAQLVEALARHGSDHHASKQTRARATTLRTISVEIPLRSVERQRSQQQVTASSRG